MKKNLIILAIMFFAVGCSKQKYPEVITDESLEKMKSCNSNEDCVLPKCCDYCLEAVNKKYIGELNNKNCTLNECICPQNNPKNAICENYKCKYVEKNLTEAEEYCLSKNGKIEKTEINGEEKEICFINDGIDGIRCEIDLFFEKECGHEIK